jgi:hypothetical protein
VFLPVPVPSSGVPLPSSAPSAVDEVLAVDTVSPLATKWKPSRSLSLSSGLALNYGLPENPITGTAVMAMGGTRPIVTYSAFTLTQAITISQAFFQVTSAGVGSTLSGWIYSADAQWQPVAQQAPLFTSVDTSGIGVKITTGLSVTLQPGRWLIATQLETAQISVRVFGYSEPQTSWVETSAPQNPGKMFYKSSSASTANPGDPWADDGFNSLYRFVVGGPVTSVLLQWSNA